MTDTSKTSPPQVGRSTGGNMVGVAIIALVFGSVCLAWRRGRQGQDFGAVFIPAALATLAAVLAYYDGANGWSVPREQAQTVSGVAPAP